MISRENPHFSQRAREMCRPGYPVCKGILREGKRATPRRLSSFCSGVGGGCSPAAFVSVQGYAGQSQNAGVAHQFAAGPGAFLRSGNVTFAPGRRRFSRSFRFLDWHDFNSSLERRVKQFAICRNGVRAQASGLHRPEFKIVIDSGAKALSLQAGCQMVRSKLRARFHSSKDQLI